MCLVVCSFWILLGASVGSLEKKAHSLRSFASHPPALSGDQDISNHLEGRLEDIKLFVWWDLVRFG